MLIKINSNNLGNIFLEDTFLIVSLQKMIKTYFNINNSIDIKIFLSKDLIDLISFSFSKETIISRLEEKNLFNEMKFLVLNKFGIEDFKIAIVYE